jgi:endonuclease/exonuclease/phosphatase family metal-dependent hydrolase
MKLAHRPLAAAALTAAALLAALPPAAGAAKKPRTTDVTVMSRNLFLGADLLPLAVAEPGEEFERAAGAVLDQVRGGEPTERMKLVAGEIAKAKPDLVGLQEVTLWKTGPKGDPAPADQVDVDYLRDLMAELRRRKAGYRVVADQRTLELEGPTDKGVDVRFIDGNVILARKGVKVSKVRSNDFDEQLVIPTRAVGEVSVNRSFNQLDARVRGAKFHFVNTHLEAYSPDTRLDQARELVKRALKPRPTVLVGDLNSGPDLEKPEDRPPYAAIARAGFKPARTKTPQCCWNDDLVSGEWDHIVDWILTKPKVKLVRSFVTGKEKTPGGRYPADHGGVVSVLRLRR